MSWINHLPPACWSTFWKSNFKQQLGYRFDIMDNISYFIVFWHMQLYMSWYIRSFFGFTFLNCLYFFKYSSTNTFQRHSFYTFYAKPSYYNIFYLHSSIVGYASLCYIGFITEHVHTTIYIGYIIDSYDVRYTVIDYEKWINLVSYLTFVSCENINKHTENFILT